MTLNEERVRELLRDAAEPTEAERLGTGRVAVRRTVRTMSTVGTVVAVAGVVAVVAVVIGVRGSGGGGRTDRLGVANSASPSPGPTQGGSVALLVGRRWVPSPSPTSTPGPSAYITFAADGTWSGSDGCNGMGGSYSYSASGSFSAVVEGATLKYCNVPHIGQWLTMAKHADVTGSELRLTAADGHLLGVFTS